MSYTFHRSDATFASVSTTDLSGTVSTTSITATAWTTFNPSVTLTSGAFTVTSGGRYQQIGKTVAVFFSVTVTSSGTASGSSYTLIDLPVTALTTGVLYGRENIVTGAMLQCVLSSTRAFVAKYDGNPAPITATSQLLISGIYESV